MPHVLDAVVLFLSCRLNWRGRWQQGHDRYGGGPGRPGPDGMPRPDRMQGMGRGGANGMAGFPPMPMPGERRAGVSVCYACLLVTASAKPASPGNPCGQQ